MEIDLDRNIQYVKGVGEARAKALNRLGIYTLEDLITYYPREYNDRTRITALENVKDRRGSFN